MSLKVSHLYKSYDKPIIQDFSYTFEDNHIYAITGPSGCGKTTLLYLLGFLEKKNQGSILIDDKEPKSIQKLYKHTIGFLFQNYALYPHMSIYDNLAFSLVIRKIPKKEIKNAVTAATKPTTKAHENMTANCMAGKLFATTT